VHDAGLSGHEAADVCIAGHPEQLVRGGWLERWSLIARSPNQTIRSMRTMSQRTMQEKVAGGT